MRVAFVEWPEALSTNSPQWDGLRNSVLAAHPDILLTNELPFGLSLAESAVSSSSGAEARNRAHEYGLAGLIDLRLPVVMSTRPVWNGSRLASEAFILQHGTVHPPAPKAMLSKRARLV